MPNGDTARGEGFLDLDGGEGSAFGSVRRGDVDRFNADPNTAPLRINTFGFGQAAKGMIHPSYFDDGEGNF